MFNRHFAATTFHRQDVFPTEHLTDLFSSQKILLKFFYEKIFAARFLIVTLKASMIQYRETKGWNSFAKKALL